MVSCQRPITKEQMIFEDLSQQEGLIGKSDYLASPFVSAGDRMYLIGHQNGSFPDLGWHVEGEMGGIWLHPIKLMDGFTAALTVDGKTYCLDKAESFTNYPFSNLLNFSLGDSGIEVRRMHFVPDGKEGMSVLFHIKNVDKSDKSLAFQFNAYVDLMPAWLGERIGMIDQEDAISFDELSNTFSAKDEGNPWFAVWGTTEGISLFPQS